MAKYPTMEDTQRGLQIEAGNSDGSSWANGQMKVQQVKGKEALQRVAGLEKPK